jgi:hypothetical protein
LQAILVKDPETTRFLAAQAESTHKTPAELIGEMVREKMAIAI